VNNLHDYALRLLKFVEDSVNEAINDPNSRDALLSEADGAMRILQRTLIREDATKHAQLMLLSVFDKSLEDVVKEYPQAVAEKLTEALDAKMRARAVF
jgi:hypothetical protein